MRVPPLVMVMPPGPLIGPSKFKTQLVSSSMTALAPSVKLPVQLLVLGYGTITAGELALLSVSIWLVMLMPAYTNRREFPLMVISLVMFPRASEDSKITSLSSLAV